MKTSRSVAALSVLALGLSACGGGDNGGGGEVGDEFNIAWNAQPPTLDPLLTTANTTRDIARNFYEPIITMGNDGEPHPVLAESFELSDDHSELTFTLRDDVTFHDGEPMTEEDVIASIERWIELTSVGQSFFEGTEIDSPEDGVVTMHLPEPMFAAPLLMADQSQVPVIMKAEIIAEADSDGVPEHIGTGPFEMVEWATDQHVHLERFEDYTSPEGEPNGDAGSREPGVDTIYYHFVSDSSTRVSGMQTGEYDAADWIPWDNADVIQDDPNLELSVGDYGPSSAILNKAEGQLADINMRRAILAAVDPDEALQAAYASEELYGDSGAFVPEDSPWYVEPADDLRTSLDEDVVQEYLEEAGYDGEPIRILASRDYDHLYNLSVVLQDQLEAHGINTDLQVTDWATLTNDRENPEGWEIFITGNGWGSVPATFPFLLPSWAGWTESEEIQDAIDAMIYQASSEDEAIAAMDELQDAIYDYIPVVKFGDQMNLTAVSTDWEGYEYGYMSGDIFYRVAPAE
ncbi:hypothetical protein HGQ17_10220 [Nesterenkonia sp. MY13]|uniref:Solute-binding protein family 5 domain-containing protein n=1 Tax=Nesterenkonia sedimenti TaxID=1463632 RepID=A0A7X8YED1_9MICC|nr:ABC transporter substrate-binding protein [Nesterenkonia sedimenti]NLS10360.1 hypothetical protein [Nesterenkonia sedimenti]